jgi:anti-anti-sigma regulatory factor
MAQGLPYICATQQGAVKMLRITKVENNGAPVTLKLEGKVSDQWAALLDGECRSLLSHRKEVCLDLSGVNFMDAGGVKVVKSLPRQQVRIVNAPGFIEELLK